MSPIRIVRPLSDIPLAILEWKPEKWSRSRSFHRLLAEQAGIRDQLSQGVLAIQETPVSFPGIACCHFVVRTAEGETPTVLLCQRQIRGQEGTYHPGRWSLSFEEQLRPGESFDDCVKRGLTEELLGHEGAIGATPRVLAAIIEKSILNLSFIVLVDVPLRLAAIVERWQVSMDKDEHRQLATLELSRDTVAELATGPTLSKSLQCKMQPSHPDVFAETTQWDLHPTATARAAVALWVQDTAFTRDCVTKQRP